LKQRWPSNQDYETEIHTKGFARDLRIFCALQNDENYFSMNAKDFEELEQLFWHARRELKNDANLGVRLIQFGSQLVEARSRKRLSIHRRRNRPKSFGFLFGYNLAITRFKPQPLITTLPTALKRLAGRFALDHSLTLRFQVRSIGFASASS
jgi:hypothetical protein